MDTLGHHSRAPALVYIDGLTHAVPTLLDVVGRLEIWQSTECHTIAAATLRTLRAAGVQAKIMAGTMLYRAGPHPCFDVVAYCGQDISRPDLRGGYHVWVQATASDGRRWVIDFSSKYWRCSAPELLVIPDMPDMPDITWTVPPPDYFLGAWAELIYRLQPDELAPPLGRLWLKPDSKLTWTMRRRTEAMLRGALGGPPASAGSSGWLGLGSTS